MIRTADHLATVDTAQGSHSPVRRLLLLLLFIVLLVDNLPGVGLNIVRGLSAKNLFLYMLIVSIGIRATTKPTGLRFVDLYVHVPFLALIIYAITTWGIASIFSPTYGSLKGAITLKNQLLDYYLFWFAFCYGVEKKEDFIWLIRSIVIIMMIVSALTLIDFLNIPDLHIVGTYKGRLEGPFGAANQYGALQAFLLPLSIALIPREAGFVRRTLWRLGILITAILLIATGSRGAYLATFVGAMFGVAFLRKYLDMRTVIRTAVVVFFVLMLILTIFGIFNYEFLAERFGKTASGNIYSASSGRLEIWTAALLVMLEWPMSFLFGYGWNAYAMSGIWKAAHNEYLDKLFEMGAIGLTLFLIVLGAIPIAVRNVLARVQESERRIMIGFIFAMLIIIVDVFFVALPDTWPVIWVVAGLVSGMTAFYRRGEDVPAAGRMGLPGTGARSG